MYYILCTNKCYIQQNDEQKYLVVFPEISFYTEHIQGAGMV